MATKQFMIRGTLYAENIDHVMDILAAHFAQLAAVAHNDEALISGGLVDDGVVKLLIEPVGHDG